MIRLFMALFAFVAVLQAPAHAQTRTPDPERLALARELMSVSGGAELARQQMATMLPALEASLRQQGVPAEIAQRNSQLFMQEFEARMPQLQELGALAYADRFTTGQLSDLIAFYRSDAGQALLREGPGVVEAMTRAGILVGQQVAEAVAQRIQQEGPRGPARP